MDSWLKKGSLNSAEELHTKEAAAPIPKKPLLKRPLYFAIIAAVVVAIIIAIVAPLAVILPKKGHHGQKATIILPLYIYPTDTTTWSPLYNA
jgi:hypothetical protein